MDAFTSKLVKETNTMEVVVQDCAALDNENGLSQFVRDQLGQGALHWDLDLRPLEIVHSAGLGMLVACNTSIANRSGKLRLILQKDTKLTKLIKLTRLDRIMNVVII